jgi:hypothetical protein
MIDISFPQDSYTRRAGPGMVIWFIWSVWFNQTNETNQINQITVFFPWRTLSAAC